MDAGGRESTLGAKNFARKLVGVGVGVVRVGFEESKMVLGKVVGVVGGVRGGGMCADEGPEVWCLVVWLGRRVVFCGESPSWLVEAFSAGVLGGVCL